MMNKRFSIPLLLLPAVFVQLTYISGDHSWLVWVSQSSSNEELWELPLQELLQPGTLPVTQPTASKH